jgi:KAP family P-loop domain
MKFRFIADEPTSRDELGFRDFVNLIYDSLKETSTPFVYGLLGAWGSGKTSAQRMIQDRFNQELAQRKVDAENSSRNEDTRKLYVPVWFDAWKYENQTSMVFPLLHAFRRSKEELLASEEAPGFGKAFRETVVASALCALDIGLRVATRAAFGEALKMKDIKEQVDLAQSDKDPVEDAFSKWLEGVEGLTTAYENFIGIFADAVAKKYRLKDSTGVRFVVFIDDLDRCLPDVAISVIEAIKNHLSVDRSIYILGMNPEVIERGIRHKYGSIDMSGREYLEKILNYTFTVPTATSDRIAAYGSEQLARLVIDPAEIRQYESTLREFGSTLQACGFSNPRKIKRILNSYLFFLASREAALDTYYMQNIAKLIILAEYYPELFLAAQADEKALSHVGEVVGGGKTPQSFLDAFGVSVAAVLPELKSMPKLLMFQETVGAGRVDLKQHIASVRELVRQM